MLQPILRSKLYIPPLRPEYITRPRLLKKLDEGERARLVLISAPAGFGKTTLLVDWINQRKKRVAWLSLDEGDNQLQRFMIHWIASLQTIWDGFGAAAQQTLAASLQSPIQPLLSELLNDLDARISNDALEHQHHYLALDDFHVIESPEIHQAIVYISEHCPEKFHLILTTRTDPLLAIPLLRARGQLVELRTNDLRFTAAEIEHFLNHEMGFGLSEQSVSSLETRTEGWIAGLQLIALVMQERSDRDDFVRAFAGSHRYILDYLVSEVLYLQPPHIQDFLLKTSILERMTAELCDAVVGKPGSQIVLNEIDSRNLFVLPLDDSRTWYRYHQLFLDVLRFRLHQTLPHQVQSLHLKASAWFARNDRRYEAIGHALQAGDRELAARLVEETDPTFVMRGEVSTLMTWLDTLPDDLIRSRPRLALSYAWALLVSSDFERMQSYLQDAFTATIALPDAQTGEREASSKQQLLAEIDALRAFTAVYRGDLPAAHSLAIGALHHLSARRAIARIPVLTVLGDIHRGQGMPKDAEKYYDQAIAAMEETGMVIGAMAVMADLARAQAMQGKLFQAEKTLRSILNWGQQRFQPSYALGQTYIGLGEIYREWNSLSQAEDYLKIAVDQCRIGGYSGYLVAAYIALARLKLSQGRPDASGELAQLVKEIAGKVGMEGGIAQAAALQARIALARGGDAAMRAFQWLLETPLTAQKTIEYRQEFEFFSLARVILAQLRSGKETPHLRWLVESLENLVYEARQRHRKATVIEALNLLSLAYHPEHNPEKVIACLTEAVDLAATDGYMRIFVDEGEPMYQRLCFLAMSGQNTPFLTKLVAAFPEKFPQAALSPVDSLTNREVEVLRLLALGMSNQAIASQLHISLTTVKTHTMHVFDKLSVANRTQAVQKARQIKLI